MCGYVHADREMQIGHFKISKICFCIICYRGLSFKLYSVCSKLVVIQKGVLHRISYLDSIVAANNLILKRTI